MNQATATLTLNGLSQTQDGNPKTVTVVTSPPGLSGVSVTYNGSATAPSAVGSYAVVASLSNTNYQAANAIGTLVINNLPTPVITWSNPADISGGTPLSATQLNATAAIAGTAVPGTFAYTPAAGTVLANGTHNLSVIFTPTDPTAFNTVSKTVTINVLQVPSGDINGDGHVDVADALLALRIAVGLVRVDSNPIYLVNGDVAPLGANGKPSPNGVVDVADALLILRKVVGLVSW